MKFALNKIFLLGHVGKFEDSKDFGAFKVLNSSLAVNEEWKDKETGDVKKRTDWVSLKFFNKNAEHASKYLKIGDKILIEGKFRNESYKDKDGKNKSFCYVIVEKFNVMNLIKKTEQTEGTPVEELAKPEEIKHEKELRTITELEEDDFSIF